MLTALIVALIFMVIAFVRALFVIGGLQKDNKVLSNALKLSTDHNYSLRARLINYYNHGDIYNG